MKTIYAFCVYRKFDNEIFINRGRILHLYILKKFSYIEIKDKLFFFLILRGEMLKEGKSELCGTRTY